MYTVTIGSKTTRIRMTPETLIPTYRDEYGSWHHEQAEEYNGGNHNYDGIEGAVIDKAVKKLYGPRCFWFGEYNCLYRGQVFKALAATRGNSNPGNSAQTGIVTIDIEKE